MLCAAMYQTLFRQNVLRRNSSKFNDIKLSQYTVVVNNYHKHIAIKYNISVLVQICSVIII